MPNFFDSQFACVRVGRGCTISCMPRHAQFLTPVFAVIVFLSAAGWPQVAPQGAIPLWKAQWVTAPEISQRDESILHFRRVIELAAVPQHFYVDVSADNQFILHVNQQRVGTGPSRSDLGHWR